MNNLDKAIKTVEDAGLSVVRPRNNDEALQNMWGQVHGLMRMMTDLAEGGATLQIRHLSCYSPKADMKLLVRSAFMGRLDTILDRAVVIREERSDAA